MYVFSPREIGDQEVEEALVLLGDGVTREIKYQLSQASRTATWIMALGAGTILSVIIAISIFFPDQVDAKPGASLVISIWVFGFVFGLGTVFETHIDPKKRVVLQRHLLFGRVPYWRRSVEVTNDSSLQLRFRNRSSEGRHNLIHELVLRETSGYYFCPRFKKPFTIYFPVPLSLADQSCLKNEPSKTLLKIGAQISELLAIRFDTSKAYR